MGETVSLAETRPQPSIVVNRLVMKQINTVCPQTEHAEDMPPEVFLPQMLTLILMRKHQTNSS